MSWGNPQKLAEQIIVKALAPLTLVYKLLLHMHQTAYKKHWLATYELPCPVISVGNLTVGGTGKTPIIVDLAGQLLSHNIKVGILSRGYNRSNSQNITVVSDGKGTLASIEDAGDEPLMMARLLPQAVIIVGKDRFVTGQKAIEDYQCQVLLLDDGFQHWRLKRDYNIVLLDYCDELGNDNLLPAGRLREPLSALKRADHVVITKIPKIYHSERIEQIKNLVYEYAPNCPVSLSQFEPVSLHQLIAGKWTDVSIDKLRDLPTIAFCGLAKSKEFFESVKQLGADVLKLAEFSDHHHYSENDIDILNKEAAQLNAEYFVTTRKDLIKLERSAISSRMIAINLKTKWIKGMPDIAGLVKISTLLMP